MAKLKSTEINGTLYTQGAVTIDENVGDAALKISSILNVINNLPSSTIIPIIEIKRGQGVSAELF
jgi:hypothetical protein